MVTMLNRSWHKALGDLVESAKHRLVIVAPYITNDGAQVIARKISPELRDRGRFDIFTDLSPAHVANGSLQTDALLSLYRSTTESVLWHVPRLHAKVYIADNAKAIVTSGNLTANAFFRNTEYGILIDDSKTLDTIHSHFDDLRAANIAISIDDLLEYASVAAEVIDSSIKQKISVDPRLKQALNAAMHEAEDRLIRFRLAGGAVHTVFAKTVFYLLTKYGPLQTTRIHKLLQELHPKLCDDTIDRVIDGKRFGKKWKHAVRTAQQQLKQAGVVENLDGVWRLSAQEGRLP